MQQCEHAWCRSLGMHVGWLGTPRVALWRCGAGEENAGECGSPDLTGDVLFCAAAATSGSRRLQCSDGGGGGGGARPGGAGGGGGVHVETQFGVWCVHGDIAG